MKTFKEYLEDVKQDDDEGRESLAEQKEEAGGMEDKLLDFFKARKPFQDKAIHDLAEKNGIEPDDLEGEIYGMLRSFLGEGKFVKSGKSEDEFDSNEIEMGIKVEMEHTSNPKIARRIALDHLTERPDYYSNGKAKGIFDELK